MNRNKNVPPKLANRFLHWFLRENIAEEVEGDLEEQFYAKLKNRSLRKAKLDYWYQVFNYLRPFAIKHLKTSNMSHYALLQSYFKISWRNLLKQKLYSSINIGGLAIGLASFILILLYVEHELTYDQFYGNSQNIYRVYQKQPGNVFQETDFFAVTPAPLASSLKAEFPEVEHATSISRISSLFSLGEDVFYEDGIWADEHYFDVFNIPLLQGNPEKALSEPNSIVLTESMALKMFNYENPIGKSVKIQNYSIDTDFIVTGLMADLPDKSSIKYQYITSINSRSNYKKAIEESSWNNNSYHTFFTMPTGNDAAQIQQKIREANIPQKYNKDETNTDEYYVSSLADLHLETGINFDIGLKGDKKYVTFFSIIAVLIVLLACINYMNLAIARSINRAREVGLRKVIGAIKKQLIAQFLGESLLITILAFVLALALVQLVLPFFGDLIERDLSLNLFENPYLLLGSLLLLIFVGIFSGSYPAFYMSSLQPVKVLKGKIDSKTRNSGLQKFLVVGQYTVSITLITACLIIYQQMQFIQNKELGYNKDHVITIDSRNRDLAKDIETLEQEWLANPNIQKVAYSSSLPSNVDSSTEIALDEDSEDGVLIYITRVGYDYLNVFGIELLAGRNFSRDIKSDEKEGYILNETAVKALGWTPEEAIGKQFDYGDDPSTIIGVVKDFHMHSMHLDIQPLMISLTTSGIVGNLSVKVAQENLPETIAHLEKTMKKYSTYPFEYAFLNDKFDQLYKEDMRLGETFGFFTILAVIIASLGLFGLAAFTTQQRTKEIGIRKVLGASPLKIFSLLAENFLKLIAIAFVLSIPLAWYGMEKWLQDFAFRIDIKWWMFALTGLAVFLVAYLTIGYQSLKAALVNPVKSLRSE